MAEGIIVDSQEKLERVLNHLNGRSHADAASARKCLQIQHRDLVEFLTRMAVDVYNDSLHNSLPAWNWAARSLAQHRFSSSQALIFF